MTQVFSFLRLVQTAVVGGFIDDNSVVSFIDDNSIASPNLIDDNGITG